MKRILLWALRSRKVWTGIAGIVGSIVAEQFGGEWGEKVAVGILALAGVIIAGTAWEDAARKKGVRP